MTNFPDYYMMMTMTMITCICHSPNTYIFTRFPSKNLMCNIYFHHESHLLYYLLFNDAKTWCGEYKLLRFLCMYPTVFVTSEYSQYPVLIYLQYVLFL
jgi:hypothetical protein